VTPSFGQGEFIEETILSIVNQGYPDVEHIVIDGGSKDDTLAVLDRYRDRLAYVVSEADRGQSHAINKGMARATGEILTWLNSDDRLAPGALAGMAMAFHTSGADMVAGICELWRDRAMTDRHLTSCEDGPLPLEDLLDLDGCWNVGQFFYQPEVFFTRDLWNRAGGRVDENSYYSMDYELWLRFAAAGARLKVIGRPIVQFRLHPGQKTADPRHFQAELPKVRDRFLAERGLRFEARVRRPAPLRPARIVFFNDIGFNYGAGIAHARLASAMQMGGHDVTAIASKHPRVTAVRTDQHEQLKAIEAARPDLLIVGNLHGAGLPPSFLAKLAERWPTAFVVHDLWIVTGRCGYTKGCEKLFSGCDDSCPTPEEYPALAPSLIAPAWAAKRHLLSSDHSPLLLANSEWTRSQVQQALVGSSATKADVVAITLGISKEFSPVDRRECRRLLGLPETAFLILLSASSISEPRKGRAQLFEALSRLNSLDAELLLVGWGDDVPVPGFRVHRFLFEHDPKTLATIYAAADVFVGPSLEECLGQVFLEAAACGVPSIGYAVGGVPEALQHEVTGLLASDVTPEALADAIRRIHGDAGLRNAMSIWARLAFENERTLECSYHRLHTVLRAFLPDGPEYFGRKISLLPEVAIPRPQELKRTLERAYHRLLGLVQRFLPRGNGGFGRLRLHPPADSLRSQQLGKLLRTAETWQAVRGFAPWEGPYTEWNVPRCRWQEDLWGVFHVTVAASGRYILELRVRNLALDQHLRISCAGREIFAGPIPVSVNHQDSVLRLDVELEAPQTVFTCEASSSSRSPDGRSLVLLVCGLEVFPESKPKA
jgi:glycosyltransferase involved in cell wall biosynthesis